MVTKVELGLLGVFAVGAGVVAHQTMFLSEPNGTIKAAGVTTAILGVIGSLKLLSDWRDRRTLKKKEKLRDAYLEATIQRRQAYHEIYADLLDRFKERDLKYAKEDFTDYYKSIENGEKGAAPHSDVVEEYNRRRAVFKYLDQKCYQIENLRAPHEHFRFHYLHALLMDEPSPSKTDYLPPEFTTHAAENYLDVANKKRIAEIECESHSTSRNNLTTQIMRTKSALKKATDPDELKQFEQRLKKAEADFYEDQERSRPYFALRDQTDKDLKALQENLLDEWVPLSTFRHHFMIDSPFPEHRIPSHD